MASVPPSKEVEQETLCPICLEYLRDPVVVDCGHSFCQGCITNYCETWELLEEATLCPTCKFKIQKGGFRRNWQLANLIEKIKLMLLSSGKENLCSTHKEKLHRFCKEDEQLVCFLCEHSPEHQGHTILLLEEAAQQCKDKIFSCLKTLRTEKEKILVHIADTEDKSQEMFRILESTRQETVDKFRTLYQFLKEQENHLLAQIEDTEKEVAGKRDEHQATLSKELSSLESLIQELEKKQQQPASELLQDVRKNLQRYEKEPYENPLSFPSDLKWKLLDCHYNTFLENAMWQFKDTLAWAFPKRRAKVTLDPASANSHVVLSQDKIDMMWKSTAQDLSEDPEKHYGYVLGSEGFTAGCHFWEVLVGFGEGWAVGVARKPVMGRVTLTPEEGIWAVGRWKGQYKAFIKGTDFPLNLRGGFYIIRVCLNYNRGQVAFFISNTADLLYEFSGASFCGETLYPFFAVYGNAYLRCYP